MLKEFYCNFVLKTKLQSDEHCLLIAQKTYALIPIAHTTEEAWTHESSDGAN